MGMQLKFDNCSKCDCGRKRPVVNVKFYLCEQKNQERLHPEGKERIFLKKKSSFIRKKSEKQKIRDEEIKEVYAEVDKGVQECSGCGSGRQLTRSHIIPRSRRKDLETKILNIVFDCMDCHTVWEHGEWEEKKKLLNFEKRMEYIKSVDSEYYELLILKNG